MEDNENKEITPVNTENTEKTDAHKKEQKPEKKRESGRRRLFADYQYRDYTDKHGKKKKHKVYVGKHYGYVIPKEYKKREKAYIAGIKLRYDLLYILLVALWLACGFIKPYGFGEPIEAAPGAAFVYVLLPYLVGALPLLLIGMTLVEFTFTGKNYHEQAFFEALTKNFRGQTVMSMICSCVCALAEIVFLITNKKYIISFAKYDVALVLIMLAMGGTCLFLLRFQEKFVMEEKTK